MHVDHRRFDIAMPQELLNGSNVRAAFEQMRGKNKGAGKSMVPGTFSAPQRNMVHTAYELPDKLDALTELITTTATLAALAVASDLSSQRVYDAAKRLIHHKP